MAGRLRWIPRGRWLGSTGRLTLVCACIGLIGFIIQAATCLGCIIEARFGALGGVLLHHGGQWHLQQLNVTGEYPTPSDHKEFGISVMSFNLRMGR